MHEPLDLSHLTPLGGGSHRLIYDVPGHPELLIKVMRDAPTKPPKNGLKRIKNALKARHTQSQFRFLFREYNAYIKAKLTAQQQQCSLPVSDMRGLVVTTQGLGMLVEKVVDAHGQLAPRLTQLAREGRLEKNLPLLNRFVDQLFSLNLLANDVNRGNVVLGVRNNSPQFILVDGLGDSHFIPIRSWSRRANHRSLSKRMHKIAGFCDIHWNASLRCFEPKQ